MKLTAQIAATYLGSQVAQWLDKESNPNVVFGELVGIEIDRCYILMGDGKTQSWAFYNNCQLILKPMSLISDEDATWVGKIASDWDRAAPLDAIDVHEWLPEVLNGNCATTADYVSGVQMQELIDFLRSRSYDLGYGSIPSLINAGIAITAP